MTDLMLRVNDGALLSSRVLVLFGASMDVWVLAFSLGRLLTDFVLVICQSHIQRLVEPTRWGKLLFVCFCVVVDGSGC